MEFLKKNKKVILIVLAVLVLAGVGLGIYFFIKSKETDYPIPDFESKSKEEICKDDYEVTTEEVMNKLADTLYDETYESQDFRKNPIEFLKKSIFIVTNEGVEKKEPIYSVGYTYNTVMTTYVMSNYFLDYRMSNIYGHLSNWLYRNSVEFTSSPEDSSVLYWHQNRDSACFPLMYKEYLNNQVNDALNKLCYDLYNKSISIEREAEGSFCPVKIEAKELLTELSDLVEKSNTSPEVETFIKKYKLKPHNYIGRSVDFLILNESNENDFLNECTIDSYFQNIANGMIYIIEDSTENSGKYSERLLLEMLNVISYGISSDLLKDEDIEGLLILKNSLLTKLSGNTYKKYSINEPYGSLEVSYMEICMRDSEFFSNLDESTKLGNEYEFDKSCNFEKIITENLVKRSCELTNGEDILLYSPIMVREDGEKSSVASIPYSSRLLLNLFILQQKDEDKAK